MAKATALSNVVFRTALADTLLPLMDFSVSIWCGQKVFKNVQKPVPRIKQTLTFRIRFKCDHFSSKCSQALKAAYNKPRKNCEGRFVIVVSKCKVPYISLFI